MSVFVPVSPKESHGSLETKGTLGVGFSEEEEGAVFFLTTERNPRECVHTFIKK